MSVVTMPASVLHGIARSGKRWNLLARKAKLARLRHGGVPRVLDLFAGCGGLSLGFSAAGCRILAAVESDPIAVKTHALNFLGDLAQRERALHAQARDIKATAPSDLIAELGLGSDVARAVDIIVGGPPCQAFARVGRAKLREVATHPEAYRHDPRANLYLSYLDYVEQLQPLALLVENVPDVLSYGGNNIPQVMCEALTERGYLCKYTLLNAAYYGVPQMRERMFLLAYAEELGCEPEFPAPAERIGPTMGHAAHARAPYVGRSKPFESLLPAWHQLEKINADHLQRKVLVAG